MKSLMLICGTSELGAAIATCFGHYKNHWRTLNIDSVPVPSATSNLSLDWGKPMESQLPSLYPQITAFANAYDCIISAGHAFEPTKFKDQNVFKAMDHLNRHCMSPALLAAHLAVKYLGKGGLLMLRGAYQVVKDVQNENPVYGTMISMMHGLGDFMANSKTALPEGAKVLTLAPDFTLAGETARKPEKVLTAAAVAEQVYMWANAEAGIPANGAVVGITGNNGVAIPEIL